MCQGGLDRTLGCERLSLHINDINALFLEKSRCHTLPEIPHAKTKVLLEDGVTGIVYIQCKEGYTPEEISIECKNGRWETPPKCLRKYLWN